MKLYGFGDVVERSGLRKLASALDLNATIFLLCGWASRFRGASNGNRRAYLDVRIRFTDITQLDDLITRNCDM
jgi:hypothetical protein